MYSQKEKKTYFKNLREEWKKSKAMSEKDDATKALYRESGVKGVSYLGFYIVLKAMQHLNLDGLPYIDCKTFKGWQEAGFIVKKGEKSKIKGITWINPNARKEEGHGAIELNPILYPKLYHLFHKSQVEPIQ